MLINVQLPFTKLIKKLVISFLVLYVSVCVLIITSDYKSYGFIVHNFKPNCIKLYAHLQVTTGPSHYLEEDDEKVRELLEKNYPGINTFEIELTGNTPYKFVDDPVEIGDLTVYGYFDGVIDIAGFEKIPVFKVEYYDYPYICLGEGINLYLFRFVVVGFIIFIFIAIVFIVVYVKRTIVFIIEYVKRTIIRIISAGARGERDS